MLQAIKTNGGKKSVFHIVEKVTAQKISAGRLGKHWGKAF